MHVGSLMPVKQEAEWSPERVSTLGRRNLLPVLGIEPRFLDSRPQPRHSADYAIPS